MFWEFAEMAWEGAGVETHAYSPLSTSAFLKSTDISAIEFQGSTCPAAKHYHHHQHLCPSTTRPNPQCHMTLQIFKKRGGKEKKKMQPFFVMESKRKLDLRIFLFYTKENLNLLKKYIYISTTNIYSLEEINYGIIQLLVLLLFMQVNSIYYLK